VNREELVDELERAYGRYLLAKYNLEVFDKEVEL